MSRCLSLLGYHIIYTGYFQSFTPHKPYGLFVDNKNRLKMKSCVGVESAYLSGALSENGA